MYSVLKKQTTSNWGPNRKSHSAALQNCAIPFFWKLYTVLCFLFSKGTASVDLYGKMRQGYNRIWGRIAHLVLHVVAAFTDQQTPVSEASTLERRCPFWPRCPLANLWGTGKPLCKVRMPLCNHSPLVWMRILVLVIFCLSAPPDLQDSFGLLVMTFSCPYDRQSQFDKGNYSLWML